MAKFNPTASSQPNGTDLHIANSGIKIIEGYWRFKKILLKNTEKISNLANIFQKFLSSKKFFKKIPKISKIFGDAFKQSKKKFQPNFQSLKNAGSSKI